MVVVPESYQTTFLTQGNKAPIEKLLGVSIEWLDNGVVLSAQYIGPGGGGPFIIREVYDTSDDALGRIRQLVTKK